ncbi:uncharacterized protein LOC122657404 [Telopea speciosissima]|uniref:uncharacterized protein LOC122657404 n=1 Tax=Telopea speciosissima TaxID=54955 RepID=UPI001CC5CBBD|nr:uncharacterized protein LOC122657404 [Telopea speciosissima]
MAWFFKRKRGPEWKQGWTEQNLVNISAPPLPFLAFFGVVILFLSLSQYTDYKSQMNRALISFQFLLFILPVVLIFLVRSMAINGRFFRIPLPQYNSIHRAGSSPWGVAALVVVLLLMISYQSSVHSNWFRPLWRTY